MAVVNLFVTAGGGPSECRIAASRLVGIMRQEAEAAGCAFDTVSVFAEDGHGPKSVLVRLEGGGADDVAASFEGTVKFVFESPLRPRHGRKNWFVGCWRVDLPEAAATEPEPGDLVFETFRAGGPGGQHQNTTDSAVRVRHIPTGITAVSRDQRSQHRNRREAVRTLARILSSIADRSASEGRKTLFSLNREVERGNPIRTVRLRSSM